MLEQTVCSAPPTSPRARRAMLRSWRTVTLTLPPGGSSLLSPVRRLITASIVSWGASVERAQDVELAASELLANALTHTEGPARLLLHAHGGRVLLEVCDTGPVPPEPDDQAVDGEAEHGRGLCLVAGLAETVSWHIGRHRGTCVKASFPLT